jgi:hypothetical protein
MSTDRDYALARRLLDDGREVCLYPMIYNVRLCIGEAGAPFYDHAWCYPRADAAAALQAVAEWDGEGKPPGPWVKEVG